MEKNIGAKKSFSLKSVDSLAIVIAMILEVIVFGLSSKYFFTVDNFLTIIQYCSITGLVSLPMSLLIISGHFDMSLGSNMAFASCFAAMVLMQSGLTGILGNIVALLAGMIGGALIGLFNSIFITRAKIIPFIATMAMMQVARGFAYILTDGLSIMVSSNLNFIELGRGRFLGIPNTMYLFIIMIAVFWFISRYTVFGRRAYIIGGNRIAARLAGINYEKNVTYLYLILGSVVGLAGALSAAQLGAAIPSSSASFSFDVISAVVLGGTSLSGGKGSIGGTVLGVLVLAILNNGLIMLNVSTYWQLVASGMMLLVAVSIDSIKQLRIAKSVRQ